MLDLTLPMLQLVIGMSFNPNHQFVPVAVAAQRVPMKKWQKITEAAIQ
jgi:hypothetical protein